MQLFIYYKFMPPDQPELKARIESMHAQLQRKFPSLVCKVMKRPNPDELGQVTWMEIYELGASDPDAFKLELDRKAVAEKLPQPRRSEQFVHC